MITLLQNGSKPGNLNRDAAVIACSTMGAQLMRDWGSNIKVEIPETR